MRHLILVLTLVLTPFPALAHKVIAGVFPAGDAIEGEIGFSNGDMATETQVIVTDEAGAELGRAVTDEDGFFTFVPTQAITHVFRADLGAGHMAEATMQAADVADILGEATPDNAASAQAPSAVAASSTSTAAALSDAQQAVIAEAVRDEIRPLRREIAAYKEHNSFQTILGGIGYIAGLFGLGFYLAARRKLAA